MNLKECYTEVREQSATICAPLKNEDYSVQPVVDVSPPKWHLAHTTWFFETFVLREHVPGYQEFHPDFNFLFNSYYENVGERTLRPERGFMTRPTVEEVMAYRAHVDENMVVLLQNGEAEEVASLVELGLQHEQQHQELLLTDIKYILGHQPLFPEYSADFVEQVDAPPSDWVEMPEGQYTIGFDGDGFCFDNELGQHTVFLHRYRICNGLVTNGEYLHFMEEGGYGDVNLWLAEGWDWKNNNGIDAPLYWHRIKGQWHHYTMAGLEPVDPDAEVAHISFFEADAYARFCQKRLATEFEWEAASDQLAYGSRWEWTNSAYLPYPYFAKAEGAIGEYNGKFMVNQMTLRGASVATQKGHSRPTYRNFFHPHLRWQYTGIRLAEHF